jgi:hypothetical protein
MTMKMTAGWFIAAPDQGFAAPNPPSPTSATAMRSGCAASAGATAAKPIVASPLG